jgi:hypothetical protein
MPGARLGTSGDVTATDAGGNPLLGEFKSSKDEDGYAKISIDLPS